MKPFSNEIDYQCWLNYEHIKDQSLLNEYAKYFKNIVINENKEALEKLGKL